MKISEALDLRRHEAEAYNRARVALMRGETVNMRPPRYVHLSELEDYPPEPKVVWIVRVPGYVGDGTLAAGAYSWSRLIVVKSARGPEHFRRGSGRSTIGRNALRHGRINWAETVRRYEAWHGLVQSMSAAYNRAVKEIDDQWYHWSWEQTDGDRRYVQQGNFWYSLTAGPGMGTFTIVHCAHEKSDLYKSFSEIFKSPAKLASTYPFLASDPTPGAPAA